MLDDPLFYSKHNSTINRQIQEMSSAGGTDVSKQSVEDVRASVVESLLLLFWTSKYWVGAIKSE